MKILRVTDMNLIRLFLLLFFVCQPLNTLAIEVKEGVQCAETVEKKSLLNGWYLWEPYQFNKISAGGYSLTGMDIQLVKKLSEKVGITTEYEQVAWGQHQQDLRDGKRDIAAGATYTKSRANYVYFSEHHFMHEG